MQPLGILAGLLGGYQQGRQLKQNRGIKQATLKAQQDDRDRQFKLEQDKFAYLKEKDENKPLPNIDTGPSTIFDRQLDPVRKYWETWNKNVTAAPTMSDRRRVIDEGMGVLPYHRQIVQSALKMYGPQIGYDGADPDLFLGGMHGISGVKYDPTKNAYAKPDNVYKQYAPPVSVADKAMIRAEKDLIAGAGNMPIQAQKVRMQALKDSLVAKYGQENADAEIPFLPGDNVPLGLKTVDVEGQPEALGSRPEPVFGDTTNPFLGTNVDGGIARRTVPQQNVRGMFGTDAPGMFAPQAQKAAYEDARYKPFTDERRALQPNAQTFNPLQGQFNVAPMFQPKLNQAEFTDPDKEFRRNFAMRVMSGTPTDQEEAGLQQFIRSQREFNPNFDPFRNPNDLRFTLEMTGDLAPKLQRSAAKMATGVGSSFEFVPTTKQTKEVTGPYSIAPKASAVNALANADYTTEKKRTEIVMRQPRLALAVAQETKIRQDMANDQWRQQFDTFKFSDESATRWKTLGISRDRLNFDINRDTFDRFLKKHKLVQEDVTFVNGLTKHQDGLVKSIEGELGRTTAALQRGQQSQWLNHDSLKSVDDKLLEKVADGQTPTPEEYKTLTPEQRLAIKEQVSMVALTKREASLNAQLISERGKLTQATDWENATRKEFNGQAQQEKDLAAAWQKYDKTLTLEQIATYVADKQGPPEKAKPAPAPRTNSKLSGRK